MLFQYAVPVGPWIGSYQISLNSINIINISFMELADNKYKGTKKSNQYITGYNYEKSNYFRIFI
jgi:hypothetical protein